LFTLSEEGVYKIWNFQGKQLSSIILENSSAIYGGQYEKKIYTWDKVFRSLKWFNLQGQLLLDPGRVDFAQQLDSSFLVRYRNPGKCEIIPVLKNKNSVYQLTLRTDKEEFQTYVYLDEHTAGIIDRYYSFRARKITEEKQRQKEEERTLRSFKVANFGIYNWDKLIGQENRIYFAADFKFDTPTGYNNVTIFLVTELNGNSVVKFYRNTWKEFSIDPFVSNKIIAVMPGNKIAIITSEELKKTDWAQVKKEGKYTFQLKTIDRKIESVAMLDEYL
jgi:hypothetical protein